MTSRRQRKPPEAHLNRIVAPVSAFGFAASLVAQIGYWFGIDLLGAAAPILFVGIFAVWFPTVFSLRRYQAEAQSLAFWRHVLTGAPPWMLPLLYATFAFAAINFGLGFVGVFSLEGEGFWRVGTSHAMVFYGAAWGVAAAAMGREEQGIEWKCTNGHDMAPSAKFCSECGAPAKTTAALKP